MRFLLLVLALGLAFSAEAQARWSGGVQYELGGDVTTVWTVEWPAFDLLGLRAGPSVTADARVGPTGYGASLSAGVTVALVPPRAAWAAMLDLTYRVILTSGERARTAPSIGLYLTGAF